MLPRMAGSHGAQLDELRAAEIRVLDLAEAEPVLRFIYMSTTTGICPCVCRSTWTRKPGIRVLTPAR